MRLYGYSTKAQDVCHWPSFARDALVFGAELEMEPRGHASQSQILDALGDDETSFFCKSDGSLDSGVELVTVPMTLEQHRNFGWREVLAGVLPLGMSGSRTQRCGMHVHVNRRAMTPLTQAKVLLFMNDGRMRDLVTTVAQRGPNTYCRPQRKTWADGKYAHNRDGIRYQPVNLTGATAEFRVFRGSLRYDRILKNLEFCHAVVSYCRGTSAAAVLDPARFYGFVAESERDYPMLASFLSEVGYNPAA